MDEEELLTDGPEEPRYVDIDSTDEPDVWNEEEAPTKIELDPKPAAPRLTSVQPATPPASVAPAGRITSTPRVSPVRVLPVMKSGLVRPRNPRGSAPGDSVPANSARSPFERPATAPRRVRRPTSKLNAAKTVPPPTPAIPEPSGIRPLETPPAAPPPLPDETKPTPASSAAPEWYVLDEIIQAHQPFPEGSLVLGIDEGGKPLVFTLDDPSIGSVLFLGENPASNRKHVRTLLASAEILNPPDLLQIDVITPVSEAFQSKSSHFNKIFSITDTGVFELLSDIFSTIESRLQDKRQLPFRLLVLDEIDQLAGSLAEESLRFLRWVLRRGPQVGVWPLATIDSDQLDNFDLKTFHAFGFHLYGKIAASDSVARYTRVPGDVLEALSPGLQGCFKIEEEVVAYTIPEMA